MNHFSAHLDTFRHTSHPAHVSLIRSNFNMSYVSNYSVTKTTDADGVTVNIEYYPCSSIINHLLITLP